jgi:hypothetical protein
MVAFAAESGVLRQSRGRLKLLPLQQTLDNYYVSFCRQTALIFP